MLNYKQKRNEGKKNKQTNQKQKQRPKKKKKNQTLANCSFPTVQHPFLERKCCKQNTGQFRFFSNAS